ncbi:sortase [Candidatus Saccharibacteria bacterium]|jgi:sortase A|nr:sortase [Candidatus Saccharibacteria bacterium]MBP9131605.1 sortase [Candidatus Saccharibacteria bacterium]
MKYDAEKGPNRNGKILSRLVLFVAVIAFVSGAYLLFLTQAPKLTFLSKTPELKQAEVGDNRIIIPSAKIDIGIFEGGEEALDKGAWHRYPERGNPVRGGNFIVSAHRFGLGATPKETRINSAFYNIEQLSEGDKIVIHWDGKSYEYEVTKKFQVDPDAVEVEDPREDHVLTMYSCTLGGRYDGRIVVEAKPKFEVKKSK